MHGKSKKAFSHNVEAEMHAGKPQDQALAIAYSIKRKKKAKGGQITPEDMKLKDRAPYAMGGYAEDGEITAKSEKRPMPENEYNDSKEVSHNSKMKVPKNDGWTDTPERRQAGLGKTYKLKHPGMVPSDAFSVRLRDQEDDLEMSAAPSSPSEQPPKTYDEDGANRQGPDVRDIADEHSTHTKPYAMGGDVDDDQYPHGTAGNPTSRPDKGWGAVIVKSAEGGEILKDEERHLYESLPPSMDEGSEYADSHNEMGPDRQGPAVPDMEKPHNKYQRMLYMQGGEVDTHHEMDEQASDSSLEHDSSIAAAIMAKMKADMEDGMSGSNDMDSAMHYAEGGEILSHGSMDSDDSDQADLSRNADEDANEEDQASYNVLRKENYSESEGLRQLDSPMDSGMHDDPREANEENEHDKSISSKIMRRMKTRSPMTR